VTFFDMATSLCGSRFDLSALRPDIIEDECGDEESKKDSNNTITDLVEICVGRITLKDADEEGERDLQAGIIDPVASGRDPARDGSGTSNYQWLKLFAIIYPSFANSRSPRTERTVRVKLP
jgi:hypothetical protein